MAIISVFSSSFSHGEEVAKAVAEEMGYQRIDEELLDQASERYDVPREKLIRAMLGPPPFFNRLTKERERNIAYIKAALAELLMKDNLVYHGFAGHLIPKNITHVLRVCLVANIEYRVRQAVKKGISEKEAIRAIHKEDGERAQWTRHLFNHEPYDENLYDILLPMHSTSLDEAVALICENARKDVLKTTDESLQAAKDFILAARINLVLAEKGHDVEVSSDCGEVTIGINRYTIRLESLKKQLEELALVVPGVERVECKPGPRFVPPSLVMPRDNFELPSKVLLVDDEREFVQTLSERLQTRNMESMVVYDGEEAIAFVETDEPEVMVLDLKMPGIDGIEVLRRVKRDHPNVEVIILTGHGSEKEKELAKEYGAFAYLNKPVDIDILAKTMKEAYRKIGKK